MAFIKEDLISNRKVNMSEISKINSLRDMGIQIFFNIKIQAQSIGKVIFLIKKYGIWLMTRISMKFLTLILRGTLYLKLLLFL